MDKTFNDLMDIVNRTKKLDGKDSAPRPRPRPMEDEEVYDKDYAPKEYDVEEPKRVVRKKANDSHFNEDSAISKLLTKKTSTKSSSTSSKPKKETKKTTKKSTTKATPKSSSKTSSAKKTTTKATPKKTETIKATPIMSTSFDDQKNSQLYEALQNSLFSGGTDISEYLNDDESIKESQNSLQELRAKREAHKINAEITKEQQEYEQLFTGSLGNPYMENEEEQQEESAEKKEINVAEKNAELNSELNKIKAELASKKNIVSNSVARENNPHDSTFEFETGNKDLDKKIAEYYRRKQEKINEFNAQAEYYEESKKEENEPVDYASIFGGTMMTRAELMGEPTEEPETINEEKNNIDYVAETIDEVTNESEIENSSEDNASNTQEPVEITTEVEPIEESIPEENNDQNNEIEDTPSVEEKNQTSTDEKEEHIKNILSDLLFSKKVHEEEQEKKEEIQELPNQENIDKEYAEAWGGEVERDEKSEEVAQKQITEPIEGDNFVMTESTPEPQEITEYIDRTPVEVQENYLASDGEILEENKENIDDTSTEELAPVDSEEETIESNTQVEEIFEQEPTNNTEELAEESVEDTDTTNEELDANIEDSEEETVDKSEDEDDEEDGPVFTISDDDDENFVIKLNNNEESENQEISGDENKLELKDNYQEEITSSETDLVEENTEEKEDNQVINENNSEDIEDNVYNLSNSDIVEDYIVSSNIPTEETKEESDEQFENIVSNEKIYEDSKSANINEYINDEEDSTFVMSSLPEKKYDLFGNEIRSEEEEEEKEKVVETKDDTISKEEFYNEMARLQENLINELKGNKIETESVDFFAEKPAISEEEINRQAEAVADELIENLTTEMIKEQEEVIEEVVQEEEKEDDLVGINAEPVDPEKFDDYNLLNKEVALSEEDLEFAENSEEEKTAIKDDYFYLSPEDNKQKASVTDEYLDIYKENNNAKEVGDINFFKNIGNATPSSSILNEEPEIETKEDEIEAIYTLMGIEKKPVIKPENDLKVLYVTSECQPFIASGGLGDVAGSLPKEVAKQGGVDIRVILPLYGNIKNDYRDKFEYIGNFTVHLSWRQEYCGLFRYFKDGVTYYFIDNERYFKRDKLYGYYDDGERFAYFSKAIVEALPHLNFFPDIIHCNDWQSSLVSTYIKTGNWADFRYYKIKHIYTIHNVEYQGVYGMENLKDLFGIDPRFRNEMEYNGDINLTKAAIQYSDKFTTVSHSYCDNLKQPYCSRGLHHIIIRNEYKLSGIINGIDYDFYNPATDTNVFKNFDIGCLEDKVLNKKLWQDELGLPVDGDTPMIAIVSRLVSHKGLDLVSKVIENVLQQDIQLVVVGTGDQRFVDYYKYLENKYPTKVRAFVDSYSNEIARKAYAASDIFLMPSKIEPCGISQMIASRYGSVPIVREVGGLKDTIKDFGCEGGGNGYTFTNYNPNDLEYQLNRAIRDFSNRSEWKDKMKICMNTDFTWEKPAKDYINLYKSLV